MSPGETILERLPLARGRPLLGYGAVTLICALAFGVRTLAEPVLPLGYPYVSFFPAVILSTFLFGVGPGMLAGLLCGLIAWYCFIPPLYSVKMTGGIAFTLIFYAIVVAIDIILIDWMQRANRRLAEERERSRRLAERGETLFRELQHRVSNNLQVVGGLLALQMRNVTDDEARLALDEAARRLSLIGRIHRQLYDPYGEQLHLVPLLDQLVADLIDASGRPGVSYEIEAAADIDLAPEAAVPIALIVAESVSNAIEHGFAGRDGGRILIRADRPGSGGLDLSISDDGAGLAPGFNTTEIDSLGLKLVQMLSRQLGGTFTLESRDRTIGRLVLPKPRVQSPPARLFAI